MKLTEKTVALLGYGRANRAVRAYLAPFGCRFTVYTEQPPDDATAAELAAAGVPVRVGAFPAVFREQVLARSPGIRPDLPAIAASVRMGAVLLEESGLLLKGAPVPVIGITGSDGKTTTAALSAALLSGAGVGILVLIKANKSRKEKLIILAILVLAGTVFGLVGEFLPFLSLGA